MPAIWSCLWCSDRPQGPRQLMQLALSLLALRVTPPRLPERSPDPEASSGLGKCTESLTAAQKYRPAPALPRSFAGRHERHERHERCGIRLPARPDSGESIDSPEPPPNRNPEQRMQTPHDRERCAVTPPPVSPFQETSVEEACEMELLWKFLRDHFDPLHSVMRTLCMTARKERGSALCPRQSQRPFRNVVFSVAAI